MPDRPAIPAHITREILIESGHRCAVCGANCPLERAHIIPWHKSKEHKAEDLICLCASCHERADLEQWGEATLREYKKKPWILRQDNKILAGGKTKLQLTIDMELEQFDEVQQRLLRFGIAGFLGISPEHVQILSAKKANSIHVVIELPGKYAAIFRTAYRKKDWRLKKYLAPFVLHQVIYAKHAKKRSRKQSRKTAPKNDPLISIYDAAKLLNLTVGKVRNLVRLRLLTGLKRRGKWYFKVKDIENLREQLNLGKLIAGAQGSQRID